MKASFKPYKLKFKKPSGTSRGVLTEKLTYLLLIEDHGKEYLGECALFKGLSFDDKPNYEDKLQWVCDNINLGVDVLWNQLREWPSIQFGLEQAFQSLSVNRYSCKYIDKYNPDLYESAYSNGDIGIQTNGLIWMGSVDFMRKQIEEKLIKGFKCIKIKIGVDWNKELKILHELRKEFSVKELELRVDANGGFSFIEAKAVLQQLSDLEIHSIEQPIKPGQINKLTELCAYTPTPIALDEELIGVIDSQDKFNLLEKVKPQYIILKPSLLGGVRGSLEWIDAADICGIPFWVTSALESNVGLNAIAQWTAILYPDMPQGLGTGELFTNNFPSRLELKGEFLYRNKI